MTTLRVLRLGLVIAAAVCAFGTAPREADATALYGGQASATLTVLAGDPVQPGILLFASQPSDSMDTFISGDAFAFADASATGDDANRLWNLEASVFGQANSGPGVAFSQAFTDIEIQVSNSSLTSTLEILFEFDYTVGMGGSVTDPVAEVAGGKSRVTLDSAALGPLFDLEVIFNPQAGDPGGNVTDEFQFSIVLAPGQSDTLSIAADATDGIANVDLVPVLEPATLSLFGLGVLGLTAGYRRRTGLLTRRTASRSSRPVRRRASPSSAASD